jgi:hypothetical protein
MRLAFGMKVVGSDGVELGTLDFALIDPVQREVTHMVARSGRLGTHVLVPLNMIQGSADDQLLLHATAATFEDLPRYEARRTELPAAHRVVLEAAKTTEDQLETLEEALELTGRILELGPATRVITVDEFQGRLVGVAAEEATYRLSEVIVRGLARKQDRAIAARWVTELRPGWIELGGTRAHLARLVGVEGGAFVTMRRGAPRRVIERQAG